MISLYDKAYREVKPLMRWLNKNLKNDTQLYGQTTETQKEL